ncbi:MAG: outer membrane beta-barrel protein [Planctomycetota bacterium]
MRYFSVALGIALLSVLTTQPVWADEFIDEIFSPRSGLYVSGAFGTTFDFQANGNDISGSTLEVVYDLSDADFYVGSIGAYLNEFRIEFEVSYFEAEYDDFGPLANELVGDVRYLTFMGNLLYDIPTGIGPLNIFIGGGAGFAVLDSEGSFTPPRSFVDPMGMPAGTIDNANVTYQAFSIQGMAGLSYEIIENVHIFGGYRARWFSEDSTTSDDGIDLIFREHTVQSIEGGIRIDF